jgi:hypothetical protein
MGWCGNRQWREQDSARSSSPTTLPPEKFWPGRVVGPAMIAPLAVSGGTAGRAMVRKNTQNWRDAYFYWFEKYSISSQFR